MSKCGRTCGLCTTKSNTKGFPCWYDKCIDCNEIRIEHRYGFVGCRANGRY